MRSLARCVRASSRLVAARQQQVVVGVERQEVGVAVFARHRRVFDLAATATLDDAVDEAAFALAQAVVPL